MGATLEGYISRCRDPKRKAAAEGVMSLINTRRKYKADILEPGSVKLQSGRLYKAEVIEGQPAADQQNRQPGEPKKAKLTERERLQRELKKNEIRHLLHKLDPGYSDKDYLARKTDLISQLATLKASGTIKRTLDGQLIECRTISIQ